MNILLLVLWLSLMWSLIIDTKNKSAVLTWPPPSLTNLKIISSQSVNIERLQVLKQVFLLLRGLFPQLSIRCRLLRRNLTLLLPLLLNSLCFKLHLLHFLGHFLLFCDFIGLHNVLPHILINLSSAIQFTHLVRCVLLFFLLLCWSWCLGLWLCIGSVGRAKFVELMTALLHLQAFE